MNFNYEFMNRNWSCIFFVKLWVVFFVLKKIEFINRMLLKKFGFIVLIILKGCLGVWNYWYGGRKIGRW